MDGTGRLLLAASTCSQTTAAIIAVFAHTDSNSSLPRNHYAARARNFGWTLSQLREELERVMGIEPT
jgi:hypothetical protein